METAGTTEQTKIKPMQVWVAASAPNSIGRNIYRRIRILAKDPRTENIWIFEEMNAMWTTVDGGLSAGKIATMNEYAIRTVFELETDSDE